MFVYCVEKLHLSDDAAYQRIHVARVARAFPALFPALADGRLHMASVRKLAPYLTPANVDDLIIAATRMTREEVDMMLARRFPVAEELTFMDPVVEIVAQPAAPSASAAVAVAAANSHQTTSKQVPGPVRASVKPMSPRRFALEITIDAETEANLRRAQDLSGANVAHVLDRALKLYVAHLERRKFARTSRPRATRRAPKNPRTIPANARRAVVARDGERCAFVAQDGRRCNARRFLEFDHVRPVSLGGDSTGDNLRLRCRTHNQLEADRALGAEFMRGKRAAAERDRDIAAALRNLGMSAREAQRALEQVPPEASFEEGLRAALAGLRPGRAQGIRTPWRTTTGDPSATNAELGAAPRHAENAAP
jgi:5-methylcytosine-specific restriction endonuclease McrA